MKKDFAPLLLGRDRRLRGRSEKVLESVTDQESFDELFRLLFHNERLLVIRAADAIEKISGTHPEFLARHRAQLFSLLNNALHKELKWHLALLIARVELDAGALREAWRHLTYWASNPNESKLVRVNALQGLFDLATHYPEFKGSFDDTLKALEHEPVPSIKARIKRLRRKC